MRLAALGVCLVMLGMAADARAESCSQLRASSFAKLSPKAQARLVDDADAWAETTVPWKKIVVQITIDRAPHLVRAILQDCPGIRVLDAPASDDTRHFQSVVSVRATSFAAVLRLLQLPAVRDVSIFQPAIDRIGKRHLDRGLDSDFDP